MREDASPAWDVNEWITSDPRWQTLVTDAGADRTNIFYPVQQDPEGGFPYVRYSSTIYAGAENFWYHHLEMMYAMYFVSAMDSTRAMNIIFDKVSAGDISGLELERWRREQAAQDDIYNSYTFHSCEWVSGGSTQPTEERGGAHARMLTFRVWYSPLVGSHIS